MAYTGRPSVNRVYVSSQVVQVCVSHAYLAEKEEIIGMLFGRKEDCKDGSSKNVVYVWGAMIMKRSDRKKDRVETSPEQLYAAMEQVEAFSTQFGLPAKVVGWYHSHPHITALPSHIDSMNQFNYQRMDDSFIGLIFSVFNPISEKESDGPSDRLHIIAFQAVDCNLETELEPEIRKRFNEQHHAKEYRQIPFEILPPEELFKHSSITPPAIPIVDHMYRNLRNLVKISAEEERAAFNIANQSSRSSVSNLSESKIPEQNTSELKISEPSTTEPKPEPKSGPLPEPKAKRRRISNRISVGFQRSGLQSTQELYNRSVYTKSLCKLVEFVGLPVFRNILCNCIMPTGKEALGKDADLGADAKIPGQPSGNEDRSHIGDAKI